MTTECILRFSSCASSPASQVFPRSPLVLSQSPQIQVQIAELLDKLGALLLEVARKEAEAAARGSNAYRGSPYGLLAF